MTSPETRPQVVHTRGAAELLRQDGSPIASALATHLDAVAAHWVMWFPAEPTRHDVTAIGVVNAVLATYPLNTGADAGPVGTPETRS